MKTEAAQTTTIELTDNVQNSYRDPSLIETDYKKQFAFCKKKLTEFLNSKSIEKFSREKSRGENFAVEFYRTKT